VANVSYCVRGLHIPSSHILTPPYASSVCLAADSPHNTSHIPNPPYRSPHMPTLCSAFASAKKDSADSRFSGEGKLIQLIWLIWSSSKPQ
jgi:hypothetical protein